MFWTISNTVDIAIKEIHQSSSGGDSVAIFTLRFAPNALVHGVRFLADLEEPPPDAERWIPFIEEGIREYLEERQREGNPVGMLKVSLIRLLLHEVDSKAAAFRRTAKAAIADAIQKHGIMVES